MRKSICLSEKCPQSQPNRNCERGEVSRRKQTWVGEQEVGGVNQDITG